jgi:hypothetical protein
VAPNFMVVIPNDTHVELTYGRTGVEWLSYALTLLGVVGLVLLLRRPPARFAADGGRGGRTDDADGLGPAGDPADRAGDGTGDRSGAEPDGAEAPG